MVRYLAVTVLYLLFTCVISTSYTNAQKTSDTIVSATIGEFKFTLFGYTSPQALVTLDGVGIQDQTFADEEGYFEFNNRFSPLSPREPCLTAQDQFGRVTPPTCLAPFPVTYNVTIGPVVLPATTSLDDSTYYSGDSVVVSGQTTPNSEVNMSMFTNDNDSTPLASIFKIINPIKSVNAYAIPEFQAVSDEKGNFSLVLSAADANKYRFFTQTTFDAVKSPKSLTLHLEVYPIWMVVIHFLFLVFQLLWSRIFEVIIVLQLLILAYYLYHHYLHPHQVRSLVLRDSLSISLYHASEIEPYREKKRPI